MVEVRSGTAVGATVGTAELEDDSVTTAKIGADLMNFKLIELKTGAAAAKVQFATLPNKKVFYIIGRITSSTTQTIGLTFNDDATAARYCYFSIQGTTNTITDSSGAVIFTGSRDNENIYHDVFLRFVNKSNYNGNARHCVSGNHFGSRTSDGTDTIYLGGFFRAQADDTAISSVEIISASNFAYSLAIYCDEAIE